MIDLRQVIGNTGNPQQIIQMIKGSYNPMKMLTNMIKQNFSSNQMLSNAIKMMEDGNVPGVEELGENVCKEKGINPDEVMRATKNMFGMK